MVHIFPYVKLETYQLSQQQLFIHTTPRIYIMSTADSSDDYTRRSLKKRFFLLQATAAGNFSKYHKQKLQSDLSTALDEHQQNRMISAIQSDMKVYPDTKGICNAESSSSNDKYTISSSPPTCTCSDFLWNCDYEEGQCCKHIWKIRLLRSIGAIPDKDRLPDVWIATQITEDLKTVYTITDSPPNATDDLRTLREEIERTPWYDLHYGPIYAYWYICIKNICKELGLID